MRELSVLTALTMSSLEIAEMTGKEHRNVMRDIREMLSELYGEEGMLKFEHTYQNKQNKQTYPCYKLPKDETLCLITGYSAKMRMTIIKRWAVLEQALSDLTFKRKDVQAQLDAMELLQSYLPPEEKRVRVNFIKANQVVNKATSNYFGFTKALRKEEMDGSMLIVRQRVMDDYLKLYEMMEGKPFSDVLYRKYEMPLIGGKI